VAVEREFSIPEILDSIKNLYDQIQYYREYINTLIGKNRDVSKLFNILFTSISRVDFNQIENVDSMFDQIKKLQALTEMFLKENSPFVFYNIVEKAAVESTRPADIIFLELINFFKQKEKAVRNKDQKRVENAEKIKRVENAEKIKRVANADKIIREENTEKIKQEQEKIQILNVFKALYINEEIANNFRKKCLEIIFSDIPIEQKIIDFRDQASSIITEIMHNNKHYREVYKIMQPLTNINTGLPDQYRNEYNNIINQINESNKKYSELLLEFVRYVDVLAHKFQINKYITPNDKIKYNTTFKNILKYSRDHINEAKIITDQFVKKLTIKPRAT
jgi:hypothetical protein